MPQTPQNHGLGFIYDTEEHFNGFVNFLMDQGKQLNTYSGGPYLFFSLGKPEFWLSTETGDDGGLRLTGIHTHSSSDEVWENSMVCTDIDLSDGREADPDRLLVFNRAEDNAGMLPIHVLNPDVLPSLMEDDTVTIQVVALPFEINYFADSAELDSYHSRNGSPNSYCFLADGVLSPVWLLAHSDTVAPEDASNHSLDDQVIFRGTVKAFQEGYLTMGGQRIPAFIKCIIDTPFGELEIDHSVEQVPEEMRKNMKAGAAVCGICILSGDVALDDYKNGYVKNHENDLKAVRYSLVYGKGQRLKSILEENVQYESDRTGKSIRGADAVVDFINQSHDSRGKTRCFAHMATVCAADDVKNPEYPVGTRCIVVAQGQKENYSAIVFLECNKEGLVTRITETGKQYRFKLDTDKESADDISSFLKEREMNGAPASKSTSSIMLKYRDMAGDDWLGVATVKCDEEGRIRKYYLGSSSGQRINLSMQDNCEEYPDIHEPPKGERVSLSGSLFDRAKYLGLIDGRTDTEELSAGYRAKAFLDFRFREALEDLLSEQPDVSDKDIDTCLGNLFGYILAKAVEEEILQRQINRHPEEYYGEHVSFSASEAYSGRFRSILYRLKDEIALNDVIKIGASFYQVFTKFCAISGTEKESKTRLLNQALMVMNHIGKLYAPKFIAQQHMAI